MYPFIATLHMKGMAPAAPGDVYDDVFRMIRWGGTRGASAPNDHAERPAHKAEEYGIYAVHFGGDEHNR